MKRRTSLLPVILVGIFVLLGLVVLASQNGASQGMGQNKDQAGKVPVPQETGVPCPVPSSVPSVVPSVVVPVCEVPFTDVEPDAYYYDAVEWAYCSMGLGGYSTNPPCASGIPCFLPDTPMTRGQAAKLISTAFLWRLQQLREQFSDVPVGSPFFKMIGQLRSAGAIMGYDGNTYRPGDPISRGQFMKMAVISLHLSNSYFWPTINPAENTFEDILRGNPLFSYAESAAAFGAIRGYACGGPGEPCGTGNKPFFRPNATLSRAQASVFALHLAWGVKNK